MRPIREWSAAGVAKIRVRGHSLFAFVQVQLLQVRGLGSKAALVLTALAAEGGALKALRALLQPTDLAALAHIAIQAARHAHSPAPPNVSFCDCKGRVTTGYS